MPEFFERHKAARLAALILAPLVPLGLYLWGNRTLGIELLVQLEEATRGAVLPETLAALAGLVLLLLIISGVGGIAPDDAGLDPDKLGRGVGLVLMTWVASQILGVLPRVVAEDPVVLHRAIEHGDPFRVAGQFLAALGLAAVLDLAFRGFLLVQLYRRFHKDPDDPEHGLGRAIAVTVLLGNLVALPAELPYATVRAAVASQALLAGFGLYATWLWLRSRNLFFVIGVHGLMLAPSPVVAGPRGDPVWYFPTVVGVLAGVWALLWPRRD